ncbi:4-galactosyl-N-acetylglucosaminide 3-alpha-L-fucosyltransferase 9-like [Sardina pilchardus]|uniref:4-galactosyl-N-acetylglucosaminide 3-alpha-L-fucosyltransferase 9-like n=1 Tax=Sardina pilchardus TaxID=27697 RepID=UPI002E0E237E
MISRFLSRRWSLLMFIVACIIVFGNLLVQLPYTFHDKLVSVGSAVQAKAVDKTHIILLWHWPYGNAFSLEGGYCKEHFDISNCIMVADRSRFPEADLVVFHNWELARTHTEQLPVNLTRPEKQRWVWVTRESPLFNGDVKPLNGYFNLTMTYRRDSDIYTPYGIMLPKKTVSEEPLENFIPKNKDKLVCWVVSNFKPKYLRTAVYQKLKKVIPVEVYGKGGNRTIDQEALTPTISRCYFYLSFENSVHKDYITEKLWYNGYRSGAVPVVLGPSREEYEAVADKDSFIHVNDFNTVEELGVFLKNLTVDKERYASYFSYRRKYNAVRKFWTESLCKFCPTISTLPPYKVYEDLDAWQNA